MVLLALMGLSAGAFATNINYPTVRVTPSPEDCGLITFSEYLPEAHDEELNDCFNCCDELGMSSTHRERDCNLDPLEYHPYTDDGLPGPNIYADKYRPGRRAQHDFVFPNCSIGGIINTGNKPIRKDQINPNLRRNRRCECQPKPRSSSSKEDYFEDDNNGNDGNLGTDSGHALQIPSGSRSRVSRLMSKLRFSCLNKKGKRAMDGFALIAVGQTNPPERDPRDLSRQMKRLDCGEDEIDCAHTSIRPNPEMDELSPRHLSTSQRIRKLVEAG